jgi:hypothetical protein
MPYENLMRIIYMKGILNEADPVFRRPDFLSIDYLYRLDDSLWWDGEVPDIDTILMTCIVGTINIGSNEY